MHKNQLQELAQKNGYNLPSYACIREGPDHAPKFKATVLFNGETYASPGYVASLRQAEHAAAEVALRSLHQCNPSHAIAKILDESGVCKNLLQETAQRAGVPLPNYNAVRSGPGHLPVFSCSVEVAGLQFSGEAARTKKQAEKNAALSAWSALKRHAGRNQPVTMEDFDVTDEAEQNAIARALANAYNASSAKSSPAILSCPGVLPAGMYLPSMSANSMTSAPLYTRSRSSISQNRTIGTAGPLYTPRNVSTSANRVSDHSSGRMGGDRGGDDSVSESLGSIMGAPPQFPRMTHSSSHIEPASPAYTRRSVANRSGSSSTAANATSVPNFPTQPLVSQTVPRQPGLGLPPSNPSASSETSRYTSIAMKPGMAYQPRTMRGSSTQSRPNYALHNPAGIDPNITAATADGRWTPSRSVSSNGRAGLLPNPTALQSSADVGASAMWARQSSSMPYWPAGAPGPVGAGSSSRPVSSTYAGGRSSGASWRASDVKQCRSELEEEGAAAAEATTRQILGHLCL